MKQLLLVLLVFSPAWGDFKSGLQAYEQGDFATALKEWRPLAEKGDANAQYNLGLLFARGQGVTQNYAQAAKWYREAADQGVAGAQYNLGVMYSNGQGLPKDTAEALKWYLKAAEQDVVGAQNNLGTIYDEGEGAFKNYSEAEKWYRRAAEKGVASAQFNLGVMYDLGQGVTKDYAEAAKWYRQAAEQGNGGALCNLGILYYNGQGVPRDLVQAYAWFARAEKAGDPRAGGLINVTADKLKPKQIKEAQQVAANWQPKPVKVPEPERMVAEAKPTTAGSGAAGQPSSARASPPSSAESKTSPTPSALAPSSSSGTSAAAAGSADRSSAVWTGVERIVAVGDLHGDYEQFVAVLKSAGLIDDGTNWTGGKTHLVQTGDVLDRGSESRQIMNLLMKLEKQAQDAGGRIHALIGNHEAMNVYGDLRYVSPAEFAAFRTEQSEQLREQGYEQFRAQADKLTGPAKPETDRAHWIAEHPPGMLELRQQLGPTGRYGKWISGHDTIVKIDDTLFVHAGLGPKYVSQGIDKINQEVRGELQHPEKLHGGIAIDEEGPLWYKGLAKGDEKMLQPVVDAILQNFGVSRIVVGHSYANAALTPRFDGRVILIDIGLSRVYDNIGKLGCLVIEKGTAYALHRGKRLDLPKDEGPDLVRYLKQAAALDPPPSPLAKRLTDLEQSLATGVPK